MIDAHCHLNFHKFETDYDEVITRAKTAGVTTIINTGTQISSSQWAVELAEKYQNLYAIVGIHPHHADKVTKGHPEFISGSPMQVDEIPKRVVDPFGIRDDKDDWLKQLETLAKHSKVIGIGECGLDYHEYQSNGIVAPTIQKEIFIKQLTLAHKLDLPLQLHSRHEQARIDMIEILQTHKHLLRNIPGMFHCMAGSKESLKAVLDLGFYVGFDGNSMYDGLPPDEPLPLKELLTYAPLDRIVIETDSPYLTPLPHRGKRNEPAYAILIAQFLAREKSISFDKLVEQTDKNVYTVFEKLKTKNAKRKITT